jgi:hypothetical protein
MTKKRQPAKPDAPKTRTWKDEVRAQNEIVGRRCIELGIDQAELFLRARERLIFCCQQIRKRSGA